MVNKQEFKKAIKDMSEDDMKNAMWNDYQRVTELRTKLTHYEAVERMKHVAIYAHHSFCGSCGYGNRHGDKWMLSVGIPEDVRVGGKWKYKVDYYDSFAELVQNLTALEAQDVD